jgi:hypothetical protein
MQHDVLNLLNLVFSTFYTSLMRTLKERGYVWGKRNRSFAVKADFSFVYVIDKSVRQQIIPAT